MTIAVLSGSGEGAVAAYVFGALDLNGGECDEAHGEVGDGDLVLDAPEFVVCGLLDFALAESGEVLLDDDAF